jgi:hypothetical protein
MTVGNFGIPDPRQFRQAVPTLSPVCRRGAQKQILLSLFRNFILNM